MASLKNLFSTLLHAPRTLSFPISPPRTHFFVGSLRILSFFFFFSATFADTSPVVAAQTLVSRLLPTSNRASPTTSCAHLVSNSHGTRTEGASLSAVKETRKSPRNSESDAVGDLSSCDIFDGNWVLDDSEPVYPPGSCPYIDDAFNCFKNGRPDSDYLRFRWKPQGCQIPRWEIEFLINFMQYVTILYMGLNQFNPGLMGGKCWRCWEGKGWCSSATPWIGTCGNRWSVLWESHWWIRAESLKFRGSGSSELRGSIRLDSW